jgi:hypothetical protein
VDAFHQMYLGSSTPVIVQSNGLSDMVRGVILVLRSKASQMFPVPLVSQRSVLGETNPARVQDCDLEATCRNRMMLDAAHGRNFSIQEGVEMNGIGILTCNTGEVVWRQALRIHHETDCVHLPLS